MLNWGSTETWLVYACVGFVIVNYSALPSIMCASHSCTTFGPLAALFMSMRVWLAQELEIQAFCAFEGSAKQTDFESCCMILVHHGQVLVNGRKLMTVQ